jgi:hypothetical protein
MLSGRTYVGALRLPEHDTAATFRKSMNSQCGAARLAWSRKYAAKPQANGVSREKQEARER